MSLKMCQLSVKQFLGLEILYIGFMREVKGKEPSLVDGLIMPKVKTKRMPLHILMRFEK